MRLVISVGRGLRNPRARACWHSLEPHENAAEQFAGFLRSLPADTERWWSNHCWRRDRRSSAQWQCAAAVVVDLDFYDDAGDHVPPPVDAAASLAAAAQAGQLPGSIWSASSTGRGARLVAVLHDAVFDPLLIQCATQGLALLITHALAELRLRARPGAAGYAVDEACVADLARLYWAPRAIVNGQQRDGEVLVMRAEVFDPNALAAHAPTEPEPPTSSIVGSAITRPVGAVRDPDSDVRRAAARWNVDHLLEWPAPGSGQCPTCGHRGCFGRLPERPTQWACFSADHEVGSGGTGRRGNGCWYGDALDIAMRERGLTLVDLLHADGYLESRADRDLRAIATALSDVLDELEGAEERQAIIEEGQAWDG